MQAKKTIAITSKVLNMIFAASRDTHPLEFGCVLRADDGVITEVILVPGLISSERYAIFKRYNLPVDFSVVGSAHSHPTPNATPSDADLNLFQNTGSVHIIVGYPYNVNSWKAYDREGTQITLKVI